MADKQLKIELSAETQRALSRIVPLKDNLDEVRDRGGKAEKGLRKINNSVGGKPSRMIDKLNNSLKDTGGHLLKIGKYAAVGLAVAVAGASTVAGAKVIQLGVKMEQTRLSFQTMMGEAAKGNAVLGMLNEMANITPFSNDEVVTAGKTLLSFGIQAEQLRGNLKMIGDVSAGTGKSFTELSAIFGKVFAKGKADSEALNQMSEAGIPIVKTLGEMYGKTGAEVYKMAENGELGAQTIQEAFRKMTGEGGIFADMMAKQSETVGGLWSTVTGKLEYFAATLGEQVTPLLKIGLQYIMGWVDELLAMARDGRAVQYLAAMGMTGVIAVGNILKFLNNLREAGTYTWQTLGRLGSIFFESLQGLASSIIVGIVDTALAGINLLIDALNKIPRVNIDKVKSPEWVEQMRQWRDMSDDQIMADVKGLFGGDLKESHARADAKNEAIDKTVASITEKIGKWQLETQDTIARRRLDEKKYEAGLNGGGIEDAVAKIAGKTDKDKIKAEKISFDRLTKMGLYNFGEARANPIKAVDVERNNLLKQILDAARNTSTTTILA
ncbi:MAG: tape measure protein [Victivallaceae bacterium]|nr:tape measure protein [Victivallaceae bacterium]